MSTALTPPIEPSWPAASGAAGLSSRQKAAIIVRLALASGAEIKLSGLPEKLQAELVHQMSGLKSIDNATVNAVVEEFLGRFDDAGLSFPAALSEALDIMAGSIAPEIANRMRKQAGLSVHADPWSRIAEIDSERLLPLLNAESIEVAAVVLSKLKVSKSAELLGKMDGPRARRIAYAISLTGTIAPRVVDRIGHTIAEQFDTVPEVAFTDGPVERVGAILNFSPAATRDEVLEGLAQDDEGFASEVRKAIFTFANIPERIDPRDIPKIIRDVEQDVLVTAMAGADGKDKPTCDFILENMSKRMAEALQEEMTEKGEVKPADAEAAMTQIVIAIRELEAAGDIFLLAGEDDE